MESIRKTIKLKKNVEKISKDCFTSSKKKEFWIKRQWLIVLKIKTIDWIAKDIEYFIDIMCYATDTSKKNFNWHFIWSEFFLFVGKWTQITSTGYKNIRRKKNNFKRIDITYSWTIIPGCTIPCVPIFFSFSFLFEYREFYHKFIFTCH